jgi:hypothetical protein
MARGWGGIKLGPRGRCVLCVRLCERHPIVGVPRAEA